MKAYLFAGCDIRLVIAAAAWHFDETIDRAIAEHGRLAQLPMGIRFLRYRAAERLGLIDAQLAEDLRIVAHLAAISSECGALDLRPGSTKDLVDSLHAWRKPALGGPALARIAHDPELRLRTALATLCTSLTRIAETA